jgi:hypothetical protein
LNDQFNAGRLYAVIASRPGQSGRCDGYILEGRELEFYLRKIKVHLSSLYYVNLTNSFLLLEQEALNYLDLVCLLFMRILFLNKIRLFVKEKKKVVTVKI